jgi:hypothetical protein
VRTKEQDITVGAWSGQPRYADRGYKIRAVSDKR